MSQNSLCRELPLDELILLARHACRVSGYLSLKSLAEYFPSLDIKTHLLILESLLRSRHIKRSARGYYTFVDPEDVFEGEELNEELRALADAKRLVERVRLNLPPSVVRNKDNSSTLNSTIVASDNIDNTVSAQGSIGDETPDTDQQISFKVEESQESIPHQSRSSTSLLSPSALPNPTCNGSQYSMGTSTASRDSTFSSEACRSAQGIKRKLDEARRVRTTASQDAHPSLPAVSCEPPSTIPSTSAATTSVLAATMAALKLAECEDISASQASGVDFVDSECESKSSSGSLDPDAPEFTPHSPPMAVPPQSTTFESLDVLEIEFPNQVTQKAETEVTVESIAEDIPVKSTISEHGAQSYAEGLRPPGTHVNLLPPPPKPRPLTSQPKATPFRTPPITSAASSSRGSAPPPYCKAREDTANKFHWTKKKTGEEVEDPCNALEVFCRYNRLKAPAYNVIFVPSEEAYLCMLVVGSEAFKSYPTMSLTKKRAMEVAAEKAVAALGITASMVARYRDAGSSAMEL